ncbi:MAG TPA: hypothetical protein VFV33_01325, partial [Gemmatimonadaceae bacterium]|nr:hypothetical protein [Gemmatimonadaceae bacterium]
MLTPGDGVPGVTSPHAMAAGVATPPAGLDVPVRLVCIATDLEASIALQGTIAALLPGAHVEAGVSSLVRGRPDADGVIIAASGRHGVATSHARELRARGYAGPIVLVVDAPDGVSAGDRACLGLDAVLAESAVALQLPEALQRIVTQAIAREASPRAVAMHASLARA